MDDHLKRYLLILFFPIFLISPLLRTDLGAATIVVPTDYATIQEAITAAIAGDVVLVEPGTYGGPVTLRSSVSLRGRETARTIITGGSGGIAVNAISVSNVSIKNFTITQASTGINATEADVNITNNIFNLGTNSTYTAVKFQNTIAAVPEIVNNTFYQNNTAISSNVNLTIKNNIFFDNAVDISIIPTNASTATLISFNAFSANPPPAPDLSGATGNILGTDPLFAGPASNDFHLKSGSPCLNQGDNSVIDSIDTSRSDMGAYGGNNNEDSIPMRVSGITITATAANSITLTWNANQSYLITDDNLTNAANPHGYRIYYGATSPGLYDNSGGTLTSPVSVNLQDPLVTAPPFTLTGLTPTTAAPSAPTLAQPTPANQTLKLVWTAVPGATFYRVHYGISTTAENHIDVGNVTTYDLQGLTNGQSYMIAVQAFAQAAYYLAVTAFDNSGAALVHGVSHESAYSSPETVAYLGSAVAGGMSPPVSESPEAITANPNLPNKGCFIATAAYGRYSAPQVRALRKFRDEYLLTCDAGKAFVRWYYEHGPKGARFLVEHPWLKPVVRTALLPAVAGAMFLTGTSGPVKAVVVLFLSVGAGSLFLLYRRKLSRAGGRR